MGCRYHICGFIDDTAIPLGCQYRVDENCIASRCILLVQPTRITAPSVESRCAYNDGEDDHAGQYIHLAQFVVPSHGSLESGHWQPVFCAASTATCHGHEHE